MPLEAALQPGQKWAFDAEVADSFEEMLRRSIPQYEVMRAACFELGRRFVQAKTDIVDLGCARGEALIELYREFGATVHYVGLDVSEPMLAAARERFACAIANGIIDIRSHDLRVGYPPVRASLTLCVLTLQFTPIEHRLRIARDIFRRTAPGGALVLVEKVLGASADLDAAFCDRYWQLKGESGYSREEIERKRLALEGVLVPVTAAWNVDLLRSAGFAQVDCFWRWMNFAGWLAVKD